MLSNVAVPLLEPVPAFELGVLCETFGLDRRDVGLPHYDFAVCGERTGPMSTTSGISVVPSHRMSRLARADLVVVVAAAPPLRPLPPALVRQLRAAVDRGATVASVCTGAFVLAAAGLLDGRRATTHWLHAPLLARMYPKVRVEPDRLYVEDGPIATSAGSAAAIDLCLHLIRRAHGADVANTTARHMVVSPHRRGGQSQYVQAPVADADVVTGDELAPILQWMQENLDQPLPVASLAARALMSPRTFARRFRERTGTTPAAWLTQQRLLLAERLLERSDDTITTIAAKTGLGSTDTLRRHLGRSRGITPYDYRRTFRQAAP